MTQAQGRPVEARPFTETPQFKLMRALVGAANPFVKRLLRSRLAAPMGRNLLLLRFKGRRSGKTFTTPVSYTRRGDRIVVVTSPTYRWWRNVAGGATVAVWVDGRWQTASARLLLPTDAGYDEAVALQVAERGPGMLRGFGVPVDDDGRMPEEARSLAPTRAHIVQIDLTSSAAA
jgi:hypothetical protein